MTIFMCQKLARSSGDALLSGVSAQPVHMLLHFFMMPVQIIHFLFDLRPLGGIKKEGIRQGGLADTAFAGPAA
jgi:hypothetical protein